MQKNSIKFFHIPFFQQLPSGFEPPTSALPNKKFSFISYIFLYIFTFLAILDNFMHCYAHIFSNFSSFL